MDNGWTSNGDFTRAGIADRCQLPVQPLTIIILANFACPRKIFIFQPTVLFLPFAFLFHQPIRFDRKPFDRFFEFLSFRIVRSTIFDFVCVLFVWDTRGSRSPLYFIFVVVLKRVRVACVSIDKIILFTFGVLILDRISGYVNFIFRFFCFIF